MIINVYKSKIQELPEVKYKELIKIISQTTGVGRNTICSTISEYKKTGTITSPNKKKIRPTINDKLDDFQKNAIRQIVHSFWHKREIPTLQKILVAVHQNEDLPDLPQTNLYRVLKGLNFQYTKRVRNSALIERDDIVIWRNKYLESIRKYRQQGRPIYYLDETWVNAGDCTQKTWVDNTVTSHRDAFLKGLTCGTTNPSGKGKRIIVVHIGSDEGFVPGGLLSFESKKNSNDYHEEMNGETFFNWIKNIIPLLKKNAVVVMDNASYHSIKIESYPTESWRKADIEKWLYEKGVAYEKPMIIPRLLEIVKQIKPKYDKYVIDEFVKNYDIEILRLPPYHCELNPIELAWSSVKNHVKMNNTTFKLSDVHKLLIDGVERVTPNMWKNFVEHTIKQEDKFWEIDFIVYDVMENMGSTVMTITGETDSDSDCRE